MAAAAIGIDLGTTSACAAHLRDGDIAFLCPVPEGIPAVLALDETGTLLVGEAAKKRLREAPEAGLSGTKRLIGRSSNTVVDQVRQLFTYEVEDGEDDSLLLRIQEEVMTLEQVTAAILGEVKRQAEEELDADVHQAVITVPAYFNDRQREAVVSAARLAGLDVLSLLNEPTAAALAYGHGKGLDERVAVFDLGGGTLDIAVIDIEDNVFEVVAAGGDTFLGGVDFDEAIAQWALASFLEKHPVDELGPFALPRIRSVAEEAKIALSDRSVVPLFVPVLAGASEEGLDLNEDISREQLEDLTKNLLEQSVSRLRKVLEHAGDRPISKLLIIGGQSQMPSLKAAVLSSVGLDMEPHTDPRTSVATGAAIFASSLAGNSDLALTERLNLSISIGLPDGSLHRIVEAGENLPTQCSRQFTTHQDNQSAILLELFQGNGSTTDRCERLGSLCFGGLRAGPAGHVQLSVRFRLNEEGRLDIRAIDPSTGETVEAHLDTTPAPTAPAPKATPLIEEPPSTAPPPFRMPLPGLQDLQSTLQEEEAEQTPAEEAEPEPEEKSMAPHPVRPLLQNDAAFESDSPPPASSEKYTVQLGDNRPYPLHLSFRDWVRDFFGGLFGR